MTRAIQFCVVVCLISIHLAGFVRAIYDPSATTTKPPIRREPALPWYLNGKNSKPPGDFSRSSKWSNSDDFGETQAVEPPGKAWGDWRKVSGSDIEQRSEAEADFGQQTTGQFPTEDSDQSWVREPFADKDFQRPGLYDPPHEIFGDEANFSGSKRKGSNKNTNYEDPLSRTPEIYEGVPVDSKKPRQEKILKPSRRTSTVAIYDEISGVQCPHPQATGHFVYPPDCKFFVGCHQGRAHVQPCAPGTLFNPETLECDFPHKVRCYGGEIADFPKSDSAVDSGRREPLVNPPDHRYGHPHVIPINGPKCHSGQSGYFAHPSECTKFIQCDNGGTVVKDCGPGTVFNPTISVCDWPYNVNGCEDAFKKDESSDTDLTPPEPNPYENYESKPQNSWKPVSIARRGAKKIACPAGHSGMLPHPETCKKFLQCANGITYIMDCGPGTAFNPETSICDWPYKVPGCSEDRPTHNSPITERPQVPPDSTGEPYEPWNGNWQGGQGSHDWNSPGNKPGRYDQDGSHSHQHQHQQGGHVANPGQHDRPNPHENQGESQTGNPWQTGYPGGNSNDYRGTTGRWQPTPRPTRTFPPLPKGMDRDEVAHQHHDDRGTNGRWQPASNPMRPFPPLPTGISRDDLNRQHHDHRRDGPGPSHNPNYHGGSGSDEDEISQVPSTHHYNSYPHSHTHNHAQGNWNPEEGAQRTERPVTTAYPHIDVRTDSGRRGYGRTNTNFSHPGPYGSTSPGHLGWQSPVGTTNVGYGDKIEPSQPVPAGRQPGVFVPSSWRGQGWSESGNHGPRLTPTPAPRNEWNQGGNRSPQDDKFDAWLSKTNVIQRGDSGKEQDTKMNDWRSKTNIFDAQQGSKRPGLKTSKVGPSGIYVNVDGVKGHYITKEIEINQGHSKTVNYGKDSRFAPAEIANAHNNSYGYQPSIGWKVPTAGRTYPSKYEPIGSNSEDDQRGSGWSYQPVNKSQSGSPIYGKPNYAKYPDKSVYTPKEQTFETEKPRTGFHISPQETIDSGPAPVLDSADDRRGPGWKYTTANKTQSRPPIYEKPNEKVDRGPRANTEIELPTVSIEEDDDEKNDEPYDGKDYETINFTEPIEPDPDKYNVDVLDDKESWQPHVAFENKTKKSNDNSVIMSINKKTTDVEILDVKLSPEHEDEPPFPVYYVAPVHPLGHVPKPMKIVPGNGQILRLRGGSSPRDGYLEVQGIHPGWGIVCDSRNGWSLNEAHVVCRQLGYTRGAEMAWQGRSNWDDDEIPWIASTEVACRGNETKFQSCKFVHGDQCHVKRDSVGVRCVANRVAHCRKDEVAHEGKCYHLANPDSGLNHNEALEYCASKKAQLVDITTQSENDFLSEWLLHTHPNVVSIMTSGIGFTTFNRTLWLWEDSARAKFLFSKWWPGWRGDRRIPPSAGSRPVCVVMKKQFPCETRPEKSCSTDYFFWDIEDCATSMKGHSYICERPYDDISCVYGKGQQYAGNANVSASGKECLPWNDPTLVHAIRVNILNPEVRDKLMGHNFCRNPNPMKESRPWCFTGSYGNREYCDIPPCGEIGTKRSVAGGQCKPKHFECMPGECIPSPWVCDGEEDCTNGIDEKSCSSHLGFFKKTEESRLEGHDVEKWLNTPLKTCALRCKEADFTCKSFSHKTEGNVCLLSDKDVGATGDLRYDADFDYYEMTDRSTNCDGMFICGNNKCVNQSEVCDGKNNCGDRTDENICTVENLDYEIRLAGSNSSHEGRVEVKVLGHWGQVCDDGFGMIDADVVCKELGFDLGALEVRPGGYYGNLDPPDVFMVDQLKCRGNETSLRECDFDGWGVHNCLPEEAVGIVCKSAVNTCQLGHWKCDNSPTCIPVTFICDEVVDCPDGSDESSAHCDTPFELRLANGSSPLEGRVEVRHHGVWGTVCDDDFSVAAAKVICRSLGYGGSAIAKKNGFFGPGDGPIWLDEVFCHGSEAQLYKCEHNHWGRHNCNHDEDASVICTEGAVIDSELESDPTQIPEISINDLLPSDCGKRAEDFGEDEVEIFARVVQGSVATKGSYPWQASIRVRGHSRSSHWCGAVVLSPLHVLTAAHCLEGYNKGTYFVRAGDYNSEVDEGTEIEANIEDYYIHEDFRKGQRMNNDIALVLLKGRGIPLGEHIMPICLPPANAEYSAGLNCTISGFGSIESGRSDVSLDLRYGWVPLIDQSVCRADYVYGDGNISDGMVCAGYLDEGVDSCDGDSGGPLACQRNGAFTLYGVTSWGHHCGKANKPGVYVRVAHYRDWIDRKIRESLFGR